MGYLFKSGWYQAKLLYGAESIDEVLEKGKATDAQRKKLRLILDVREFAAETLHLDIGKNYTTVNLDWADSIYNVSASKALAFEPYRWCFLIVGCVPYKGHFVEEDARREAQDLENQGYDTALRTVGGYSSLGYFQDPVWPQMLERSEGSLTDLIIHELAHRTVFFADKSDFNESFANFVGKNGAVLYFLLTYGEGSKEVLALKASGRDEDRYVQYMSSLYRKLDDLYQSGLDAKMKLSQKNEIISEALTGFGQIRFETKPYKSARPKNWNNASLMTFKVYNSGQEEFGQLLDCFHQDWQRWLDELRLLRKEAAPLEQLRKRLNVLKNSGACGDLY